MGPLTDKLYAVLPAGVEIKTPSEINFFIIFFFPIEICKDTVCLLCLNNDISLIAKAEIILFLFVYLFI